MSTSRPFAYNTGSPISGTDQIGDLAIGTDLTQPYAANYGGVQWWEGPDEDLGYVICKPISAGDQPNPVGIPCYIGFERSDALTDQSFLNLANVVFPGNNFPSASNAKTWMNANGYWTSYVGATGSTGGFTITINEVGPDIVMNASGTLNITDLSLVATNQGPMGGSGIGVSSATFIVGSNGSYYDEYSGFSTVPSNFGSGSGASSTSSSGDIMGVIWQGAPPSHLIVPTGYTSGTYISGSQTFNSQTFSSLGLTQGTYTYTWGTGPNADSINVIIGSGGTGGTGATGGTGGTGGTGATGNFNITITQVGPNVVWSGSGKFNLTALTSAGTTNIGGGYLGNQAIWAIGPYTAIDQYSGTITYPTSFGTSGTPVTSNTGSTYGILPGGSGRLLYVPSGYTSNSVISGTSTYNNTTIAGMGLSGGTYTWSWGSGANTSTIVMVIS